jgi:hypothetical protein
VTGVPLLSITKEDALTLAIEGREAHVRRCRVPPSR